MKWVEDSEDATALDGLASAVHAYSGRKPAAPRGVLDAQGRVALSLPCRECQYNLKGQPDDGLCPECGTTIRRTTNSDALWKRPAHWLRSCARACTGAMVSMICAASGWMGLPFVPLTGILFVAAIIGGLIFVWPLTQSDPLNPIAGTATRWITRMSLSIALPILLLLVTALVASRGFKNLPILALLALLAMLALFVGLNSLCLHASRLARAVPSRAMQSAARIGAAICALCPLLVVTAGLTEFEYLLWIARWGIFILMVLFAALSFWFRRRFLEAAVLSEEIYKARVQLEISQREAAKEPA